MVPWAHPNGISIGSAAFAGLTSVTDRPTDEATQSITTGCIYIRSTAMWPKNTLLVLGWHRYGETAKKQLYFTTYVVNTTSTALTINNHIKHRVTTFPDHSKFPDFSLTFQHYRVASNSSGLRYLGTHSRHSVP